jgi:hypothetical protein
VECSSAEQFVYQSLTGLLALIPAQGQPLDTIALDNRRPTNSQQTIEGYNSVQVSREFELAEKFGPISFESADVGLKGQCLLLLARGCGLRPRLGAGVSSLDLRTPAAGCEVLGGFLFSGFADLDVILHSDCAA